VAKRAFKITLADGKTGKSIAASILNMTAELNNDMKVQQIKKADWVKIKDALKAGVHDMIDIAANFVKQRFAAFYVAPPIAMPSQDVAMSSQDDN
jgi:hypothetical protein